MKTTFKLAIIIVLAITTTCVNSQDWTLTGNAGTDPTVNFIGTTDNKAFKIKTNNVQRINITSGGNVKIGSGSPVSKLDVGGVITATGGTSDNWNSAFGWGNHAVAGYLTSYTETDPEVGTNSTGYIPRWNGTALVTGSAYDNGSGRIGIGLTAPLFPLHVETATELRCGYFYNSTVTASTTMGIYAGAFGLGGGDKRAGSFDASNGTGTNMGVRATASNSATNYSFYGSASGTGNTNYGIYTTATGGTTNYAAFFAAGNVLSRGNMMVSSYSSPSSYKLEVRGDSAVTSNVVHSVSNYQGTFDTRAINGHAINAPGYGYGVTGTGGYMGVRGDANATTYSSYAYGVYGSATGSAGIRIGVYGSASGGATNWAGYFAGNTYVSSNLMVGTTTPATGYLVSVAGKVICTEMKVQLQANWPDYVFNENYKLPSLAEVKNSIEQHKHLPGLPSAAEIEKENGFEVGDMQTRLVKKVEELTLYILQQQTEIEKLKADNLKMHSDIDTMKK